MRTRWRGAALRMALAVAVGLLAVGPAWEGVGVLWRGEPFVWVDALGRGLVAGLVIGGAAVFASRNQESRDEVARAVARGHLPPTAAPDPWRGELARLASSRSQDRVAVPVLFLLLAGCLAATAVRGGVPSLWVLVVVWVLAAPGAALVLHRHLRTAQRLTAELAERAARD